MNDKDTWIWPIDVTIYDRTPSLTDEEWQALDDLIQHFATGKQLWLPQTAQHLERLLHPLHDVLDFEGKCERNRRRSIHIMLRNMHRQRLSYWGWDWSQWLALKSNASVKIRSQDHSILMIFSYVLARQNRFYELGTFQQTVFARKIFGQYFDDACERVWQELLGWGYGGGVSNKRDVWNTVGLLMLVNYSPDLNTLTDEVVEQALSEHFPGYLRNRAARVTRALVKLGYLKTPVQYLPHPKHKPTSNLLLNIHPEWEQWATRWKTTSTLTPKTRQSNYYELLKTGRWLFQHHPNITSPEQWTQTFAAEYSAAVERMCIGEYSQPFSYGQGQRGKRYSPKTRDSHLSVIRTFFRDCQEWQWIPRRFSPDRCLKVGRDTKAQIITNPRVIADDIWAKLLWAGLNLQDEDLLYDTYTADNFSFYPVTMIRTLALVWLFAGLRSDEIRRLSVGCVRWQNASTTDERVCFLDVPVNKTGPAFTKPIAALVGESIEIWESQRPQQPVFIDRKTAQQTHYLFSYRGKQVGQAYINTSLIPLLCQKANLPREDARGRITSHRARSTIASQLANAKDPMSLLELQQWLGHQSPQTTQHYVKITPTKLQNAYTDAGYFDRNLRTIQVLLDRDAVGKGEAWLFYDLGHGYCTYDFFDQCPHRMACAKCSFYQAKGSSQAQLLEARTNLMRMTQEIPLTDDERTAVEDGIEALDQLTTKLLDVATPDGPTPRQLAGNFIPLATLTEAAQPGASSVSNLMHHVKDD
jgi:integrase